MARRPARRVSHGCNPALLPLQLAGPRTYRAAPSRFGSAPCTGARCRSWRCAPWPASPPKTPPWLPVAGARRVGSRRRGQVGGWPAAGSSGGAAGGAVAAARRVRASLITRDLSHGRLAVAGALQRPRRAQLAAFCLLRSGKRSMHLPDRRDTGRQTNRPSLQGGTRAQLAPIPLQWPALRLPRRNPSEPTSSHQPSAPYLSPLLPATPPCPTSTAGESAQAPSSASCAALHQVPQLESAGAAKIQPWLAPGAAATSTPTPPLHSSRCRRRPPELAPCRRLQGKVAIVTASTAGIGLGIVRRLAAEVRCSANHAVALMPPPSSGVHYLTCCWTCFDCQTPFQLAPTELILPAVGTTANPVCRAPAWWCHRAGSKTWTRRWGRCGARGSTSLALPATWARRHSCSGWSTLRCRRTAASTSWSVTPPSTPRQGRSWAWRCAWGMCGGQLGAPGVGQRMAGSRAAQAHTRTRARAPTTRLSGRGDQEDCGHQHRVCSAAVQGGSAAHAPWRRARLCVILHSLQPGLSPHLHVRSGCRGRAMRVSRAHRLPRCTARTFPAAHLSHSNSPTLPTCPAAPQVCGEQDGAAGPDQGASGGAGRRAAPARQLRRAWHRAH